MKPLLIISLFLIFGATGLQFVKTLGDLKKYRVERDAKDRETAAKIKERDGVIKSISEPDTGFNAVYTTLMGQSKDLQLSTNQLKSEKTKTDAEFKDTEGEIAKVATEKQEIVNKINEILGKLGGSTLEELTARLETLKTDNGTKSTELENLKKELTELQAQVAVADQKETALRKQQSDRDKAISLSARAGTITAVNPEWSFCVLNLGQNDGVTVDSRLIVKRGSQYIGRLAIIQINPRQTVADIDPKTLVGGASIQPGDQVLFDNVVQ